MCPTIHPDMQHLLDARDGAGEKGTTTAEQRRFWTAYTEALNRPAPADMAIHDTTVPSAAHAVPVRVYRPAGRAGPAGRHRLHARRRLHAG